MTPRGLGRVMGDVGLLVAAPAAASAGAVFYPSAAIAVIVGIAAVVLLLKPDVAAALAVAFLPFPWNLSPGLPVEVSATDLLIVVAVIGWLLREVLRPEHSLSDRVLRKLWIPLAAYGTTMILSVMVHPTFSAVTTLLQRSALVIGGLLLGAGLVRTGRLRLSLEIYLAAASLLAVAAVLSTGAEEFVGIQKNPAGGFIAAALLISILVRPTPRWIFYAPVLAVGLLATQSRGALSAALIAAAVCLVIARFGDRSRLLLAFAGVAALLMAGFAYLPEAAQDRLFRLSAGSDYAIRFRVEFQADALDQFRSAPWSGVGIGNYAGGARMPGIGDPHQVLVFQLAEGGYPLLVGFLFLVIGSAVAVLRHCRRSPLALAALAVQVATVVHALADIYWVRGTPTAGWLLIGASLAAVALADRGDPLGLEWVGHRSVPRHRRIGAVQPPTVALPAAGSTVG